MKVKKIFKYPTGATIPEGAVYLNTVRQTKREWQGFGEKGEDGWVNCWLVWHYFLVEVEEDE